MFDTCGCQTVHSHDGKLIEINKSLLEANSAQTEENRKHFEASMAVAVNLIISPGAGKTTLLEKTAELLFIENVGNLVCPAAFDLGEHKRVILVSVPEGSDKPAKYPMVFMDADLFVITKMDLLSHFDFSLDEAVTCARRVNPSIKVIAISARTGQGMEEWMAFLSYDCWCVEKALDFVPNRFFSALIAFPYDGEASVFPRYTAPS